MIATPVPTQYHDGRGHSVRIVGEGSNRRIYLDGRELTPETTIYCMPTTPDRNLTNANAFRLPPPPRHPNRAQRRAEKRPSR